MESVGGSDTLFAALAIAGTAFVMARALGLWSKVSKASSLLPVSLPTFRRKQQSVTVEVCVSDFESARNAFHGGATSLELCSNRAEGGTTPSMGLIEQCVRLVRGTDVELHVLIRPRAGDFVYSHEEFEIMQRDIIAAKVAGANGVVCGILSAQGTVDLERMTVLRTLSHGMSLTFHRAFDMCADQEAAVKSVLACNCDRLLTSGGENTVLAAVKSGKLQEIANQTDGLLILIAASGISEQNVRQVIQGSLVTAIHAGSAVTERTDNKASQSQAKTSLCQAPEMQSYMRTSAEKVRALVTAAEDEWVEQNLLEASEAD